MKENLLTDRSVQMPGIYKSGTVHTVTAPELSVVIPVYNEECSIAELINETVAVLEGKYSFEIIIVDDGSSDKTVHVLKTLLAHHDNLKLLVHERNYGQSSAIHTGFTAASAEWVITMDGDGQNDPHDILKLLDILNSPDSKPNLKLICGYRINRNDNFIKRISSRVANKIRSSILGDMTPDTGCGLKLVNKRTFLKLPFFDHMHRFIPALVLQSGGELISVEVNHRPRLQGVSKYGTHDRLWTGIIDMFAVLWLKRRNKLPKVEEVKKNEY